MRELFINQIFDGNLLVAMCIAALAGIVSFFSPCVIPLVPGYLSYATGMAEVKTRGRVFLRFTVWPTWFVNLAKFEIAFNNFRFINCDSWFNILI